MIGIFTWKVIVVTLCVAFFHSWLKEIAKLGED